jgi:1,4-alpha-glucan branching enzyme
MTWPTRRKGELQPEDITRLVADFHAGRGWECWRVLGAHPTQVGRRTGFHFAVWAPGAEAVELFGAFDAATTDAHWTTRTMERHGELWAWFEPGCVPGTLYKIKLLHEGVWHERSDPFAFASESGGGNASVTVDHSQHAWQDGTWMAERGWRQGRDQPIAIYEIHAGSWMHQGGRALSYRELAEPLIEHVTRLGFTHVEFLPLAEHPYYPSWGYQVTGYFAPTSRYGHVRKGKALAIQDTPDDFRWLVDQLHQAGIGVLVDWVPAHFPDDVHGLRLFDGTPLYEDPNPHRGRHPEWGTSIFDFGRAEVQSFLMASAHFWVQAFHVDGFRVDAVASMLYLDYARKEGEWVRNVLGGHHNLEAIAFLQAFNDMLRDHGHGAMAIAEESTAFPGVTQPTPPPEQRGMRQPYQPGLGFAYKWNMGWMHDTLKYFKHDPMFRVHHHDAITFSTLYRNDEAFVLPLSHDEVVHLKAPLVRKMGGWWEHGIAQLRLLFGYQWTHPGKKLLFMGGELAQDVEWNYDTPLAWDKAQEPSRVGLQRWLADLNRLYRTHPALHQGDCRPEGFRWVEGRDAQNSILVWERVAGDGRSVVVILHFTPVVLPQHWLPMPQEGEYRVLLWSDLRIYAGFSEHPPERVHAEEHWGRPMAQLDLPGYAVLVLERA